MINKKLVEVTMGLLARSSKFSSEKKKSKPAAAYIGEFLDDVLVPLLPRILDKGIKVITNAGGLDPVALKEKIDAHARQANVGERVKVAAIFGDDILGRHKEIFATGKGHGFDPLNGAGQAEEVTPDSQGLLSLNAYIGAEPITRALQAGANIIVTGRCVDSASILGPLAFEYGWDYANFGDQDVLNALASASLAGHVLECGAQTTGGNFTDWRESASSPHGGWANMGYPIISFYKNGDFDVFKPKLTGGLVTCGTVCEQMLYEVLDPENYILPDIVIDLSQVSLTQVSTNRVRIHGTKGEPPTPWLKCTAIAQRGFRLSVDLMVFGVDAEAKGIALIDAMVGRANNVIKSKHHNKIGPITRDSYKTIIVGAERSVAPYSEGSGVREVLARLSASHSNIEAFNILSKEVSSFITSSCPGICLLNPGRPRPSPNFTTASILVERAMVVPKLVVGTDTNIVEIPFATEGCKPVEPSKTAITIHIPTLITATRATCTAEGMVRVRLIEVAIARSGDKGDTGNIAIIARKPAYFPHILAQITPEAIWSSIGHYIAKDGTVTRYEVPGVNAVNFVVTKCLGGGGLASLSLDK